jgi:hypothetical protein
MNIRRFTLAVAGFALAVSLTGCGSDADTTPKASPKPTPIGTPEPVPSSGMITGRVTEQEPGTSTPDKPVVDIKSPPPVPKPSTPPVAKDASPEKAGTETGELPSNFELPAGAAIFEPASVIRGDRSFLALDFETTWQETASLLKASLQEQGWVCTNCIDYPASSRQPDEQEWRYLLTMERDGRKLNGVIMEWKGKSSASLTFVP